MTITTQATSPAAADRGSCASRCWVSSIWPLKTVTLMALFASRSQPCGKPGRRAGVRYSLENPAAYIQSNLVGFGHVCSKVAATTARGTSFASSSSVYGKPQSALHEQQPVNHPVSLYASKKANELMAHTRAHGLRNGIAIFHGLWPVGSP